MYDEGGDGGGSLMLAGNIIVGSGGTAAGGIDAVEWVVCVVGFLVAVFFVFGVAICATNLPVIGDLPNATMQMPSMTV
jgi:hypothetical protein